MSRMYLDRPLYTSATYANHSYVPCCLRWQLPRLPQFDVRVHSPHYVSLPESQGKTVLYCTRHHLRIRLPLSLLCRIDLHQDESSATLSTSFPRMWPVSIIRCAGRHPPVEAFRSEVRGPIQHQS